MKITGRAPRAGIAQRASGRRCAARFPRRRSPRICRRHRRARKSSARFSRPISASRPTARLRRSRYAPKATHYAVALDLAALDGAVQGVGLFDGSRRLLKYALTEQDDGTWHVVERQPAADFRPRQGQRRSPTISPATNSTEFSIRRSRVSRTAQRGLDKTDAQVHGPEVDETITRWRDAASTQTGDAGGQWRGLGRRARGNRRSSAASFDRPGGAESGARRQAPVPISIQGADDCSRTSVWTGRRFAKRWICGPSSSLIPSRPEIAANEPTFKDAAARRFCQATSNLPKRSKSKQIAVEAPQGIFGLTQRESSASRGARSPGPKGSARISFRDGRPDAAAGPAAARHAAISRRRRSIST